MTRHDISLNRTLGILVISKTAYYYRPKKREADVAIQSRLQALSEEHIRWGFDKMMQAIKLEGHGWNHKRVYRIYCELG